MFKKTILLFTLAMFLVGGSLIAGEKTAQKAAQSDFEGTLVCMGCDLKKSEGARAACTDFGHNHALKTADGKYIGLLENKYSADLIKGEKYHNQKMKLHGVYFANANQLDVESFEVDGKTKSWCGGCKSMDACMAPQGDM